MGYLSKIGISIIFTACSINRFTIVHYKCVKHAFCHSPALISSCSKFDNGIYDSCRLTILFPKQYFRIGTHIGGTEHIKIGIRSFVSSILEYSGVIYQSIFIRYNLRLVHCLGEKIINFLINST